MLFRIKLWLLEKAFNWCEPDLGRNIECGVLESFYAELHALRAFLGKRECGYLTTKGSKS